MEDWKDGIGASTGAFNTAMGRMKHQAVRELMHVRRACESAADSGAYPVFQPSSLPTPAVLGVSRFLVQCIVLLVAGCLLTGCRTPSAKDTAGRPPPIELFSNGTVLFHGKPMEAGDLPRKLKSRGYEPGEPVQIVVPTDAAPAALTQISSTLASAGFRRIIFVKARHAEAYVNKKKK